MSPSSLDKAGRWFARMAGELGPEGLALLTPPGFLYIAGKYLLAPDREIPADDLDARDPAYLQLWIDAFRAAGERYFRWQVRGLEHLPATGPALLVGSHNGGMMVSDSALTLVAVWDHLGPERRLYGLSHDLLHSNEILRRHSARAGVLRAGHEEAGRALRAGHMALVYPGSDLDATRAFRDRNRIELGGRKGFLRLALRERVPIIPVVSVGTHEQWIVLTRGDRLARALGVKKLLRIETFPIVFSLPWGITSGFLPYLPFPAQTTLAFGPPLAWPDLTPEAADDPAQLQRCYDEVHGALQHELDTLSRDRTPFLGLPGREPRGQLLPWSARHLVSVRGDDDEVEPRRWPVDVRAIVDVSDRS
jgi:1-acyl-sn-glycerol-3-phosphate acyltransferase